MERILCTLMFCLLSALLHSGTYYVSPTGNDGNAGNLQQPWKTIQYAIDHVSAGDTILVRSGIYVEAIYFNVSGNATDGPVVLKNYPGEKPVIEGSGAGSDYGPTFEGVSYIVLEGFEIRGWAGQVVTIMNNAHHLTFSNLDLHDFGYGVTCYGYGCHHIEFNNVECHHFAGTYDSYAFDVSYDTLTNDPHHDFIFNHCSAHSDMNPTENVDGFATGHWSVSSIMYNFTYNNCVVYDVFDGWDVSAKNTKINNCLGYNCYNGVWKLWSDQTELVNCIGYFRPTPAHPSCNGIAELDPGWPYGSYKKTVTIQNCTFYGGDHGIHVYLSGLDTLVLRNTIVANSAMVALYFEDPAVNEPSYRGDYNLLHSVDTNRIVSVAGTTDYTLGAWQAFSGRDAHSIMPANLDAVFTDTAAYNLHLKAGSPAVDAGASIGAPALDFEGYPRPFGNAVDIGAYELNPFSAVNQVVTESHALNLVPNPATCYTILAMPKRGDYLVSVVDFTGSILMTREISGSDLTHLDLSGLNPGTYVVVVRSLDRAEAWSAKLLVAGN